ncbi:MAG: glycosyltransferase, partial [Candidatus Dadabacteria bacterium]|nr:glycosyltransferase [Candidatus Dadabacteria bacterium]
LELNNSELLLIGVNEFPDGWLEKKCSKSVKYVGPVSHLNLNKLYITADVLVLPSLVEGFGLVLLEAMS